LLANKNYPYKLFEEILQKNYAQQKNNLDSGVFMLTCIKNIIFLINMNDKNF